MCLDVSTKADSFEPTHDTFDAVYTDSTKCPRAPARVLHVFVVADGCATHGRGQEKVCTYFGLMPHTKPCEQSLHGP